MHHVSVQFSSIYTIDRALSGATISVRSGPGGNGNEGVLCISQSPSITHGGGYPSAEVQSVYSTAPADWLIVCTVLNDQTYLILKTQFSISLQFKCQIIILDQ